MRISYVFFVIFWAPTGLCRWEEEYVRAPVFPEQHQPYPTPQDTMVDVTNDLANLVLQDYAYTKGNFAFSPYGVASVLVVLYEGARGETARQIHHALRLPWNRDVTRVGFRDIHRSLVSYFTHEGYLSGMTLSKNHTALREDYKRILRFYGYDVDLVKHPDAMSTTRVMSSLPSGIGTTKMVREEIITGTTPMVKEENITGTTTMVREEIITGNTSMVSEENVTGTTTMVSEENITGTTPMVKEENITGTTTMVREEIITGNTSMVSEENVTSSTSMVTPMMREENITSNNTSMVTPTVREEIIIGTTPMMREENITGAPSMMREGNITGTTTMAREESISNISVPSNTEAYSMFTVFLPTTPEPENNTSEEDKNSEVDDEMEYADLDNYGEGDNMTETGASKRMPSSTKAAPAEPSEDYLESLEDITTTAVSIVEQTTAVEETKDPTIYPSEVLNDETDQDDVNTTTTESSWNLFEYINKDKKVREEATLPRARSTMDTIVTTPCPTTEEVFQDLPTTLPAPVSSSTEESKNISFGGKAITLLAKSSMVQASSSTTSSAPPTAASNETTETRSLPVSEPSTQPTPLSTESAPNGNTEVKNVDQNSNATKVVTPEANTTAESVISRNVRSIRTGSNFPDMALELDNSMYDSHVNQGSELYRELPRHTFLVDGVTREDVPVMSYTTVFPFAYINKLNSLALEFPLDDPRYKLLILLPIKPKGLPHLIHELKNYPLRQVHGALRSTRVNAIIPSFMVEGFVILTPALQQLGIWDVFDPRRCDLSGMTADPELYVRNVEQSITVVIRNYLEVLDVHTRTMAARTYTEKFFVTHPFLYFVLDTETHVALMAGKINDPLSSRIY